MNDISDVTDSDQNHHETGDAIKKPVTGSFVFLVVLLGLLGAGAYHFYPQFEQWQADVARQKMSRQETAPAEWFGVKFGTSRADFAKMLANQGATWPSIRKPGMTPGPFAAHVDLTINGYFAKQFSVMFSDGMLWDYGKHPDVSSEVVKADTLVGSMDPEATVAGIMCAMDPTDHEKQNNLIPVPVLDVLGTPHSESAEVTGQGRSFLWDWPGLKACYVSPEGWLVMEVKNGA